MLLAEVTRQTMEGQAVHFPFPLRCVVGPALPARHGSNPREKISPWEDKMPVSLSCKSRKLAEFITDGNGINLG